VIMQSSLLERIFPPSSPLLPQHQHHPPSPGSPQINTSPSVRSSSSPPASSSRVILRPAPLPTPLIHHDNPLLHLDRASKSLQRTIQSLLDAQSEGLLAGLTSSSGQDDISSNGSLTPTPTMSSTTSPRKPTTIPLRQPSQKKISLRAARRGLFRSIRDFAALKQEEERYIGAQVQEREVALSRVEAFRSKRDGIESEITAISSESSAQSVGHLRAEADRLDIQIKELENRLFEMKARHRHLIDEAQQVENSVESKLSSYNASLELLDKEIKQFLARPPISHPGSATAPDPANSTLDTGSIYALNPKRRTLQMANDYWREEREELNRRRKAIEWERRALEDGGRVWREVINEVQTFEKDLKAQMQKLFVNSTSQQERDEGMATLLDKMDKTMNFLEGRLQHAEEKDWKLLICCIGAELEAFREGREMLTDVSGLGHLNTQGKQENGPVADANNATTAPSAPVDFLTDTLPRHPEASPDEEATSNPEYEYGTGSAILFNARPTRDADNNGKDRNGEVLLDRARGEKGTGTGTGTGTPPLFTDSRSSESENDDPGPDFLISHT
jgi:hypothetical protein